MYDFLGKKRPEGGMAAGKTRRTVLLLAVLAALAAGVVLYCLQDRSLLLVWRDPETKIEFRVTYKLGAIVHYYTYLHVVRGGVTRTIQLDDDATFGTISFVRYGQWLVVLNDGKAMGGYDYAHDELSGESGWQDLPFTVHRGEGTVVRSKRVGDHGGTPANWPGQPAATSTSRPGP